MKSLQIFFVFICIFYSIFCNQKADESYDYRRFVQLYPIAYKPKFDSLPQINKNNQYYCRGMVRKALENFDKYFHKRNLMHNIDPYTYALQELGSIFKCSPIDLYRLFNLSDYINVETEDQETIHRLHAYIALVDSSGILEMNDSTLAKVICLERLRLDNAITRLGTRPEPLEKVVSRITKLWGIVRAKAKVDEVESIIAKWDDKCKDIGRIGLLILFNYASLPSHLLPSVDPHIYILQALESLIKCRNEELERKFYKEFKDGIKSLSLRELVEILSDTVLSKMREGALLPGYVDYNEDNSDNILITPNIWEIVYTEKELEMMDVKRWPLKSLVNNVLNILKSKKNTTRTKSTNAKTSETSHHNIHKRSLLSSNTIINKTETDKLIITHNFLNKPAEFDYQDTHNSRFNSQFITSLVLFVLLFSTLILIYKIFYHLFQKLFWEFRKEWAKQAVGEEIC